MPYACKLLGFKSASMPSIAAYNAAGTNCEGFEEKGKNTGTEAKSRKPSKLAATLTLGKKTIKINDNLNN